MNTDDAGGLCVDPDLSPIHSPSSLVQLLSQDAALVKRAALGCMGAALLKSVGVVQSSPC